ncbi:MAG: 1-deoxy-D-xylulose-5-phosphate synthase [Oscillospiraceae bacterium]|nr:1-deoxy-D-xylulose-5-phosphate synthase [Oscillospiraceae bacterium]
MEKDTGLRGMELPADLKGLSDKQCRALCREIRRILIRTVGRNGGHLSSNLGTVELTVALHRVFDSPRDKIVWDVGHQSYTHKLLTGRLGKFGTLRTEGGLSGFSRPSESEHDVFVSGHSSNSISAACGIAKGMKLAGDDHHVIAVIGDGAFTGGLAYEGLNNAGKSTDNLIVILNDNEMSISRNVGAFAKYLSSIRGQKKYINTKHKVQKLLNDTPVVGKPISEMMVNTKDTVRYLLYKYGGFDSSTMFENMGFVYLGPVDGHDIHALSEYLEAAKAVKKPVLVHVMTKKGKGYSPAEHNPGAFHGLSPKALPDSDPEIMSDDCFSAVFGRELSELATYDKRICGITAAMKYGTGLNHFACDHPDRFFDVGIAEGHAVTFASGLSVTGIIPVFAVYSSFLQRSYDQLIHDAAIAGNHIVLGIDRAGFVGEDGETHQGLFDVSMLSSVPNTTIFSPATYDELKRSLSAALFDTRGIACVRYPKGTEAKTVSCGDDGMVYIKVPKKRKKRLAVSYGRVGAELCAAVTENGIKCDVLRPLKIFPIEKELTDICKGYSEIFIFEEGMRSGGFAEHLTAELYSDGWKGTVHITACQGFEPQATVDRQLEKNGLDRNSIVRRLTDAS